MARRRWRRRVALSRPSRKPHPFCPSCPSLLELQLDNFRPKFKDIKELVEYYSRPSQTDLPACLGPNSQAE